MTAPAWTEVQLAVGGALLLARGDRRGLGFFDASIDGFWRSFRSGLICYPLYLLLLSFRIAGSRWAASGAVPILAAETIAYVIAWVAFPLLMLPLARWLDRDDRFLPFMVAYNWSQIPQAVLLVLIGLDGATGLLPPSVVQVAGLLAVIAVLGCAGHARCHHRCGAGKRARPRCGAALLNRVVADRDEGEPVGRRGRSAGAAVAGRERARDIGRAPAPEPDQLQGPSHVAHLVVQERAGARLDMDFLADPGEVERVERLDRRLRLAQRVAEGRKIVMTHEMAGALLHRREVERRRDMPHPAPVERRRRPAIEDAVTVMAPGR